MYGSSWTVDDLMDIMFYKYIIIENIDAWCCLLPLKTIGT